MEVNGNYQALLPNGHKFRECASQPKTHVWLEKVALCWNSENTSSALCHGSSDQPRTSLRLACGDRSGENEPLGIRQRNAAANSLNADSVGLGIRQQYHCCRKLTIVQMVCVGRAVEFAGGPFAKPRSPPLAVLIKAEGRWSPIAL